MKVISANHSLSFADAIPTVYFWWLDISASLTSYRMLSRGLAWNSYALISEGLICSWNSAVRFCLKIFPKYTSLASYLLRIIFLMQFLALLLFITFQNTPKELKQFKKYFELLNLMEYSLFKSGLMNKNLTPKKILILEII